MSEPCTGRQSPRSGGLREAARRLAPTVAILIAATAGIANLTARAAASAPLDEPETIYACYVPGSGTVYRIRTAGAPDACHGKHTEFSWNAEGPPGITGIRRVLSDEVGLPPGTSFSLEATCPEMGVAIAAGWVTDFTDPTVPNDITVRSSHGIPVEADAPQSWRVLVHNRGAGGMLVRSVVTCLMLAS